MFVSVGRAREHAGATPRASSSFLYVNNSLFTLNPNCFNVDFGTPTPPIHAEKCPLTTQIPEMNRLVQSLVGPQGKSGLLRQQREFHMRGYMNVLAVLGIGLGSLLGYAESVSAQQSPVTAVDIALEPDATLVQRAHAAS